LNAISDTAISDNCTRSFAGSFWADLDRPRLFGPISLSGCDWTGLQVCAHSLTG
ncbi:hypothetical protein ACLOJK_007918, partial [Asimina triloba]